MEWWQLGLCFTMEYDFLSVPDANRPHERISRAPRLAGADLHWIDEEAVNPEIAA